MIDQNLNIDPSGVAIQDCDFCNGEGIIFHAISNEDFDVEICVCVPDDVDVSDFVMGV